MNTKAQPKIQCPHCGEFVASRVVDSRPPDCVKGAIWRRRECEFCAQKFSTREVVVRPKKIDLPNM